MPQLGWGHCPTSLRQSARDRKPVATLPAAGGIHPQPEGLRQIFQKPDALKLKAKRDIPFQVQA